jgi:two pore calcium channel protein
MADELEKSEKSALLSPNDKCEKHSPPRTKRLLRSSSQLHSFSSLLEREDARHRSLERRGVGQAAFLIRDAVMGTTESSLLGAYDPYRHPNNYWLNTCSIVCRRLSSSRTFRHFKSAVLCVLVVLSLVEPPNWCRTLIREGEIVDTSEYLETGRCYELMTARGPPAGDGEKDVDYYPNTSTMLLTIQQSNFVESVCLAFLWVFIISRIGRDGISLPRFFRPGPMRMVRCVEISALAVLTTELILEMTNPMEWHRIFTPYIRILLFILADRSCMREFKTLFNMMPEVASILFLLFLFIAFYSWIGVVIFYGSDEGTQMFRNIFDAMFNLWIATTTANYPDVMMPVYNENRLSTIYFVVFMIVTFFFLMNVILASVVNSYDNELDRRREEGSKLSEEKFGAAFELLDYNNRGSIDKDTVMALFAILNEDFYEFRKIPPDEATLLFAILDKDGKNSVSRSQFMEFGNVLLLEFEKVEKRQTFLEAHFPKLFESASFKVCCKFIDSNSFEACIDGILVLNAMVVLVQSFPMLMGETVNLDPKASDGEIDTLWERLETVFTCVYVVEISVKVLFKGWQEFSRSSRNIFDMAITILAVFATVYVYLPNELNDSRLIRFIVMARVLRLTRLLAVIAPFQITAHIAMDVVARAKVILVLLFCVCYVFAAFGVQVFGGMISRDPADPRSYLLLGSDFAANAYWANNFNDICGALNVLFNLLVVNNWTECQSGFEAVTQNRYNRLFFIAFHICGVVLVNNLVLAFIINAFIKQWDFRHEKLKTHVIEGEAVIIGRQALFDATKVTGTTTDLTGQYTAKIGQRRAHFDEEHQQRILKAMFTSTSSSITGES